MSRKIVKLISVVTAVLICVTLASCTSDDNVKAEATEAVTAADITIETKSDKNLLECRYFDQQSFDNYDRNSMEYKPEGDIRCGVVPHHLLAGRMISGFFKAAAESNSDVETVVIIATMHEPKNDALCTTKTSWKTPEGKLETDTDFAERFSDELGAANDNEMLQQDHSASGIIPFVKHYFPHAKTACLLVSKKVDINAPDEISTLLSEFAEEKNCLFVFSVDFSHYLAPSDTARRDEETREAVLNSDIKKIAKMSNANVDSPECICTFLMLSEKLDTKLNELDHSNSIEMSGVPYSKSEYADGLTSYFIFDGEK